FTAHQIFVPAPHAAQFGVGATAKEGRTHDTNDFPQELVLAAQAPFDLGHKVVRQPQSIEGLLEGLGGVLRLAAITCEALLHCAAATLSGFGVLFGGSYGEGHGVLLCCGWVLTVAVCRSARDPCPLVSVSMASPQRHALPGLPAFFCQLYAVYVGA